MTEPQPPDWDTDSLSRYYRDAAYNERVSALRYPAAFELLQRVQQMFERAESYAEKGSSRASVLPRILLARAHSGVFAGARLAMSGQPTEGQSVLRTAVEQSWYTLYIATDPAPYERAEIWLRRHETDEATSKCQQEFTVRNVRMAHETIDADAAATMHWLYKTLIDFGAHPNQRGVLGAIKREEDELKIDYRVGILQPDGMKILMALKLTVGVATGSLRIFEHLYRERFLIAGLDREIRWIEEASDEIFRGEALAVKACTAGSR